MTRFQFPPDPRRDEDEHESEAGMNMDEHEHESTVGDWEIVADDEPSLEDYPDGFADDPSSPGFTGDQPMDDFGAPIRPVVKIRSGVQDADPGKLKR